MAEKISSMTLFTSYNDVLFKALKSQNVNHLTHSIHGESNGATEMARHFAAYCLKITILFDSWIMLISCFAPPIAAVA